MRLLVTAILMTLPLGFARTSTGEVIIRLEPETVIIDSDSEVAREIPVDVFIETVDDPIRLASYNADITITPATGDLEFISHVEPVPFGTPFPGESLGVFSPAGPRIQVADLIFSAHDTAVSGKVGLFRTTLRVAPGALGTFDLGFVSTSTLLFDGDVNGVPINRYVGATVRVVPEPWSAGALVLLVPIYWLFVQKRQNRFMRRSS